jgi:hypothetical protein
VLRANPLGNLSPLFRDLIAIIQRSPGSLYPPCATLRDLIRFGLQSFVAPFIAREQGESSLP